MNSSSLHNPAALPFEGAPRTDTPTECPATDEVCSLDRNPRYRILPSFSSRYLSHPRTIRIYLPTAYLTEPQRRFPVFYLHDGQNLFDGRTSYLPGHSWRAHLTADRLAAERRIEPLILVGIDHSGPHRISEYTPTQNTDFGGGGGSLYGRMIVDELKPLIDRNLRTLRTPSSTALGGSSLGGLISLFFGLQYPAIFGKLAVLSPSIWWDNHCILNVLGAPRRQLVTRFAPLPPPTPERSRARVWLDIGTGEGLRHLRDCDLLARRLQAQGWKSGDQLAYHHFPQALHNEDAWAERFDQVLTFLFPQP